jgi:4-cresol dehydrogenase (hydroxylating)
MHETNNALPRAIDDWRQVLGENGILVGAEAIRRYGVCTTPIERLIPAALLPKNVADVVAVIKIARRHKTPLYPISTGNNWGYGSANPAIDNCVIVDLSAMDRILEFDNELGLVTVEPGVTQRHLREYLDRNNLAFMVPTTGAGPDGSLLGNALERGYGITPYADHFAAVTALEAVLPNGDIYRGALSEMGGPAVDQAYKWGTGPYLDGIFSQGGFGIVTRMTIALAGKPEMTQAFFFRVGKDEDLESTVVAVREVIGSLGAVTGAINLMNPQRVLSMMVPYPYKRTPAGSAIPAEVIADLAKHNQVRAWMGVGAMYGQRNVVKAARSAIKRKLGSIAERLVFVSPQLISRTKNLLQYLPGSGGQRLSTLVSTLDASLGLMEGTPSEIALPLAYWKSGVKPQDGLRKNPARDGCGLIWYAPLVPMKAACVRTYVELVRRICTEHGMDPLITLTSLSNRCFDSTVPLLYNKENPEEAARAEACFYALFNAGKAEGFVPYRLGVHAMHLATDSTAPTWNLVNQFKTAIDPDHILAPGRYSRKS